MAEVVDKERKSLDPALDRLLERERQERKDYIYCAVCSTVIGRGADRIEVNGGHDHYCINPHGLQFHIGCFQEALGCEIEGSPQAADSWFMGFRWRIANCGECRRHLGWYFDRKDTTYFYGLILDRIQHDQD